jgi:hypothetical protein
MLREIFSDNNGHLSSKRIMGTLIVAAAIALTATETGDPETARVLVWAGVASLGVGTLETKVNK